jgi:hypothetical protein
MKVLSGAIVLQLALLLARGIIEHYIDRLTEGRRGYIMVGIEWPKTIAHT